jgi:hypothetical protein
MLTFMENRCCHAGKVNTRTSWEKKIYANEANTRTQCSHGFKERVKGKLVNFT